MITVRGIPPTLTLPLKGGWDFVVSPSPLEGEGGNARTLPDGETSHAMLPGGGSAHAMSPC
jgi:hypothetical protein